MTNTINLILQGPVNDYALEIARHYSKLEWANEIVLSTWEGAPESEFKTIRSKPLSNNGIGNRNAQIVSSLAGLKESNTEFSAKLRTDQKISLDSMNRLYEFMLERPNKIGALGFYEPFPFHPRDHSFWGKTSELIELFDIPLDPSSHYVSNPHDAWPYAGFYANQTRAECYIAANYLTKKDSRVKPMVDNPNFYLMDFSEGWQEAKELSDEIFGKYFYPMPRISFEWPKHGLSAYPYDSCAAHYGEYWND